LVQHRAPPLFGDLLRRHRLAAGLSQEALAERAGISAEGISALERGYRRSPQRETLALLAGALALDIGQREVFEEAATRSGFARRSGTASVTIGPWDGGAASNLPYPVATFIGRRRELDEIASLVRDHRLVCVTGAAGVGKTQTALQVARALPVTSGEGIYFVGLTPLTDPASVASAIVAATGAQHVPNRSPLETLIAYARNKTLMLLLDNCEHVVEGVATVAEQLLSASPRLRILATSREPLRADGERRYQLHCLSDEDAVALFADRAQAVDARFTLSDANAPLVAEICRKLDGIPLAIELAAARVNLLSLKALSERLAEPATLSGGTRTAAPGQRTMRAAIDWSYDLLAPDEQRVFESLSIFVGGCTLATATVVCARCGVPERLVLDLLSSLVDKSLAKVDFEWSEPRYGLLESFRQYACEKVARRRQSQELAAYHAAAYLDLAAWLQVRIRSEPVEVWREIWIAEQENWRAAVRWAFADGGDASLGVALTGLLSLWDVFGLSERRRWIAAARRNVDETTPLRVLARLDQGEGNIAFKIGDYNRSVESHQSALSNYRELNDALSIAGSQCALAHAFVKLRRVDEAKSLFGEALELARPLNAHGVLAMIFSGRAQIAPDIALARADIAEALRHSRAAGNKFNVGYALLNLSRCELLAQSAASALQHAEEGLEIAQELSDPNMVAEALGSACACLTSLARFPEAVDRARALLTLAREHNLDHEADAALARLALAAALASQDGSIASLQRLEAAAQVIGFADTRARASGRMLDGADETQYARAIAVMREQLGAAAFEMEAAAGSALSEEVAIAKALHL
jgi:predicted ATPase/transcriptional regulator with XRE-family HTH domain